jgi:hypothetical protein
MNEYLKSFESLCIGNDYVYSQPKFKDFRQTIDKTNYFESLKEFDRTQTREVADVLSLFYRQILQQPYWYIEAKEMFPNDKTKQGQYLYDNIELAKDRFNSAGRGIHRIKNQLDKLCKDDRQEAQKLFEEIVFITNYFLHNDIGRISFEILDFNLKKSPLFIVFMEFIKEIRNRAGNPYYTEIDKYLSNIESYKERFNPPNEEKNTLAIYVDTVNKAFQQMAIKNIENLKNINDQPKTKKTPKPLKPFKEYFDEKYKETLPEICKTIFNANNRPKDYAIMASLLSENNLINIAITPAHFFKAWYSFIGREIKEGENFNAIKKHFDERDIFVFSNDSDKQYQKLNTAFEKALKDNKIK